MLRNYLKIAIRNLLRNKAFSLINIAGLSIGIACCMLILLYTKDEVSYDAFHEKKEQLHRITCSIQGNSNGERKNLGLAAMTQGPTFKSEIPEIEAFVRVMTRTFTVKVGEDSYTEEASWVDKNFFSVFSFPLLAGNPNTVLTDPHSLVLTEEMAEKFFHESRPIGKKLEIEVHGKYESFVVTGIAKKAPENSSIKFTLLLPFSYQETFNQDNGWLTLSYPTYLVLHPSANLASVSRKMNQVFKTRSQAERTEAAKFGFHDTFIWGVQPFLDMHLNTNVEYTPEVSNPMYSYILVGIAVFILLIACINFVNLTVAQSLRRGKEIGIRKVVGGDRRQLMGQFMGESFVLCLLAYVLAILLAEASLPFFNELANKELSLSYLIDSQLITGFIALFLLTGFAAGFYPALVLSGFDPLKTLYNRFKFSGKNYLSKGLIVLQFSLATFLIITTLFIYAQFEFISTKSLGYTDENLVVMDVGDGRNQPLMQTFQTEFSKIPGVVRVAPTIDSEWGTISKANGTEINVAFYHIDEHYLPTMGIALKEGRNFSSEFPSDSTNAVLVNEAYIRKAGWTGPAVGKSVDFLNGSDKKLTIVGVVRDYHYGSLKHTIEPQLFTPNPHMPFGRFLIRVNPQQTPQALREIEKTFRKLVPYHPFQYHFMDDLNTKQYEAEAKWKQIVTFGAALTIFISCIGLFGLMSLSVQQRTKEIGIRKVLGASVFQITNLLSKNFIALVLLAFVIAIPAGWYATSRWLETFAYRIDISWQVFAAAAFFTTSIALLTLSFNTIRSALGNPIHSLRSE